MTKKKEKQHKYSLHEEEINVDETFTMQTRPEKQNRWKHINSLGKLENTLTVWMDVWESWKLYRSGELLLLQWQNDLYIWKARKLVRPTLLWLRLWDLTETLQSWHGCGAVLLIEAMPKTSLCIWRSSRISIIKSFNRNSDAAIRGHNIMTKIVCFSSLKNIWTCILQIYSPQKARDNIDYVKQGHTINRYFAPLWVQRCLRSRVTLLWRNLNKR